MTVPAPLALIWAAPMAETEPFTEMLPALAVARVTAAPLTTPPTVRSLPDEAFTLPPETVPARLMPDVEVRLFEPVAVTAPVVERLPPAEAVTLPPVTVPPKVISELEDRLFKPVTDTAPVVDNVPLAEAVRLAADIVPPKTILPPDCKLALPAVTCPLVVKAPVELTVKVPPTFESERLRFKAVSVIVAEAVVATFSEAAETLFVVMVPEADCRLKVVPAESEDPGAV